MRLSQEWIVTMKDFGIFRRKRYILYSLIAGPLALSVLLPASILLSTSPGEIPAATLSSILGGEFTIFIMLAGLLPSVIGAYSFIGEKVEKSLEPLLATPTTDSELLLGKSLAAFLPSIAATYVGAVLFMAIVDASTSGQVGHLIFPSLNALLILFPTAPLACVMSVEFSIIISSRVNDIRAAQQLGTMVILPLVAIFILAQTNAFAIDPFHLLIISGILLLADLALFYVSRTTFEREEILTKWK